MSCDWVPKHRSPKAGELVTNDDGARGLLVGSIVSDAQCHAWQRFVHGWARVGTDIKLQTEDLLTSGYVFLPVRVLVKGNVVVHGLDCTCMEGQDR